MAITIAEMTDADFLRAFELLSLAFGHRHPFVNEYFPAHDTPSGREVGAHRFRLMAQDPNTIFIKAIDEDVPEDGRRNRMVGYAKWNFYTGTIPEPPELDGPWWDETHPMGHAGNREYGLKLAEEFFKLRGEMIVKSGGNLSSLDHLAVDPASQRRGVGAALTEWGVRKTDELGLGGVIEASDQGVGLYQKYGYQIVKPVHLEMPEPWAHLPQQFYYWVERPRKDGKMYGPPEQDGSATRAGLKQSMAV